MDGGRYRSPERHRAAALARKHVSSTARPSGAKAIDCSAFIAITPIAVAWSVLTSNHLLDEDAGDKRCAIEFLNPRSLSSIHLHLAAAHMLSPRSSKETYLPLSSPSPCG